MDEHSPSALDWILQQDVRSFLRGRKLLLLNKLEIYKNTPPYSYLFFRLDLELAMPRWNNQNIDLPR